jgi:dihydroorotate dehydrogenase (fumarate)
VLNQEVIGHGWSQKEALDKAKEALELLGPGTGLVGRPRRIERVGASALELNLYTVEADPGRSAADVEDGYLEVVRRVRAEVRIPLAVKLSPWFSSLANFARRVVAAGADGLVLFNRFYQPDIDVQTLAVVPRVELSDPVDLRLPLRWITILRPEIGASLALSSGVHGGADVVKAVLAGADVTMMTSALLRNGPDYVAAVERSLLAWMRGNDYTSVRQMVGAVSQAGADDPSAFERTQYLRSLATYGG